MQRLRKDLFISGDGNPGGDAAERLCVGGAMSTGSILPDRFRVQVQTVARATMSQHHETQPATRYTADVTASSLRHVIVVQLEVADSR